MRFEEQLNRVAVPEWRKMYLDYHALKETLDEIETQFPQSRHFVVAGVQVAAGYGAESPGESHDAARSAAIAASQLYLSFWSLVGAEATKTKTFSHDRLMEHRERLANLRLQLERMGVAQAGVLGPPRAARASHESNDSVAADADADADAYADASRPNDSARGGGATRRLVALANAAGLRAASGAAAQHLAVGVEDTKRIHTALRHATHGGFWARFVPTSHKNNAAKLGLQIDALKKSFLEFYRALELLRAYHEVNKEGFRKIIKKHDKITGLDRKAYVDSLVFDNDGDLKRLQAETEDDYTKYFAMGNRHDAMMMLRVPDVVHRDFDASWLFTGVLLGLTLFSLVGLVLVASVSSSTSFPYASNVFVMFRGLFVLVLVPLIIAADMFVWSRVGINYALIFNLDARAYISYREMALCGAVLMAIWGLSTMTYIGGHLVETIPSPYNPLLCIVAVTCFMVNPLNMMWRSSRFWLLRILGRIVGAPFFPVNFEDFWLADQLNSLVAVYLDAEYLFCFLGLDLHRAPGTKAVCSSVRFGLRPVLASLPAWFRLLQCLRRYRDTKQAWPHLYNAGKYSTSLFVVLFSSLAMAHTEKYGTPTSGALLAFWILAALINMGYTTFWDLRMDWGLFEKGAPHRFLRKELLYRPYQVYYVAMVADVLLRGAWVLNVSLGYFNKLYGPALVAALALAELFRRGMWNLFRLENEHVNNCGHFRAVRALTLPFRPQPAELSLNSVIATTATQAIPPAVVIENPERVCLLSPTEIEHALIEDELAVVQRVTAVQPRGDEESLDEMFDRHAYIVNDEDSMSTPRSRVTKRTTPTIADGIVSSVVKLVAAEK